jgi:hypothetical protein
MTVEEKDHYQSIVSCVSKSEIVIDGSLLEILDVRI